MQYLTTFFVSLFANNLILTGKGLNTVEDFHGIKKAKFLSVIFYFLAAIVLAVTAYVYNLVLADHQSLAYFEPLAFVLVMAVLAGIFYALLCISPKLREEYKPEWISFFLNTSLFTVAYSILALVGSSDDMLLLVVNAVGLPLGYILSFVVFEPIIERIRISNAMKGFKTAPLVLITMAGMALCFASLSF